MTGRRGLIAAAVGAGVVVLLFIVLLAASDSQRSGSVNFEIVGDVAPQIEGPTLDAGRFDLYSHRGNWVVVNFFASWCVGCRVEHPELVEFTERHQGDGTQLVSVMFGDSERAARAFFAELGGDWPAIVGDTGAIAIDYGVTGVPETLLVSPSGRVVQKWIGANGVTADEIDATIALLTDGAPAQDPDTSTGDAGDDGG